MEMSRCHLNEHAFYELMPVVLRTERVVLEGNRFFPLEMKIFARQVKECNALRLDTLVLSGCQVGRSLGGSTSTRTLHTLTLSLPHLGFC